MTAPVKHALSTIALASSITIACIDADDEVGDLADTTDMSDTTATRDTGETETETPGTDSETDTGVGEELCGNGLVDLDEVCDDGLNDGSYGGCASDCSELGGSCGGGEVQPEHETCDEGGANGSKSCNDECQVPGTVLATRHELISIETPAPTSIAATIWNGRPTAFTGSDWTGSTVWELDLDTLETYRLRETEQVTPEVIGILGLETGELFVAGGYVRRAWRFDEDLALQWSYVNLDDVDQEGFVGVAPIPGGAMLAARHVGENQQHTFSAHWVIGVANGGLTLWKAAEFVLDNQSIIARDFQALPGGRAVLLTDLPAPALRGFRIYDSEGNVEANVELPSYLGFYYRLCAGENASS